MRRRFGFIQLAACALFLLLASRTIAADKPLSDPEEVKKSLDKDCQTFRAFCEVKFSRLRDALSRGAQEEAGLLVEKLQIEEVRTLERICWYLGNLRSQKDRVAKFMEIAQRCAGLSPEEYLKELKDSHFKMAPWFEDPLSAPLESEAAQPSAQASPDSGLKSSPNSDPKPSPIASPKPSPKPASGP